MNDFMYDVFMGIIARTTCNEFDCEDCRKYYGYDECPCDHTERGEQVELAKTLFEEISNEERKNLHSIDYNIEELLDIIMDAVKEK